MEASVEVDVVWHFAQPWTWSENMPWWVPRSWQSWWLLASIASGGGDAGWACSAGATEAKRVSARAAARKARERRKGRSCA
jgi:hypothetical protein